MKKGVLYTIGSVIILIICFIAFVLPSTFLKDRNAEGLVFGKYNGRKIAYQQGTDFQGFVAYYANIMKNYGQQIDSNANFTIFSSAFNSTVMRYAYEDAVKSSGYKVPRTAVNRDLRKNFLDENGNFSKRLLTETPAETVEAMREEIESNLFTSRFYDDNFASQTDMLGENEMYGLKASSAELKFLEAMGKDKRAFKLAAFNKSDYPADEKLKFGQENAAKFNKYDFSVITVNDKSTADKVASRIAKEEITFEDAISEYSTKNYSNTEGKLTNAFQYQLENMLADKSDLEKIITLKTDEISPVIQTATGYTIYKALSEMVAPDFTSDEITSRVSTYIASYESGMVEDYFVARAKDFSTDVRNTSFEEACEKFAIKGEEVSAFPLNYGGVTIADSVNTSIAGLSGADTNENLLKTAFTLKMNELSDPMVNGNYVIVLQYTGDETAEPEENADKAIASELVSYDQSAGKTAIFNSPKFENNFFDVYSQNMY